MTEDEREVDPPLPEVPRRALLALSRTVQRHEMYPPDHPALDRAVEEAFHRLGPLLDGTEPFVVDVERDVLRVGDAGSPSQPEVIRDLAGRLHDHRVARLRLYPGLTDDELGELIRALSVSPSDGGNPLGADPDRHGWTHVELVPLNYDGLVLGGVEEEDEPVEEGGAWASLVRYLVAGESPPPGEEAGQWTEASVAEVATRLERFTEQEAETLVVGRRLMEMARELAASSGLGAVPGEGHASAGTERLRERFAKLLERLSDETVRSLIRELEDENGRRFMEDCARALPLRQAVRVVRSAAEEPSSRMLMMLRLLENVDVRAGKRRGWGPDDGALRSRLAALVREEGPGAESVRARASDAPSAGASGPVSGSVSDRAPTGAGGSVGRSESTAGEGKLDGRTGGDAGRDGKRIGQTDVRVVQTALQVDALGPAGRAAVSALQDRGRVDQLLDALDVAPESSRRARGEILDAVDLPDALDDLLHGDEVDVDAVRRLAAEFGEAAIPALIDTLAESESMDVRRELYSVLSDIGQAAAPHLLERLHEDDRWFVRRNMLSLLAGLPDPPEPTRVEQFRGHERSEVRIEVFKLLLDRDPVRTTDLRRALQDEDRRLVTLGLGAAAEQPTDELGPLLARIAADEDQPSDVRTTAVRALGPLDHEAAPRTLLDLAQERSWWPPWSRDVGSDDPVSLAALRALARHHRDHPEVRDVLSEASESSDEAVRAAARGEEP